MKGTRKKTGTDAEKVSLKDRWKRMKKGQRIILSAGILLTAAVLAAGGTYFFVIRKNAGAMSMMRPEMNNFGENVIAASGLTSTGLTEEKYELDFLETKLFVEASYLSMGDTVEKGTKVFKVSDDSLKEAKEELETAVTETELAYRQGLIDYEKNSMDTDIKYQTAQISAKYVQAEYDSSLQQPKSDVEDLQQQVEDAQALYDEYTAVVESDYYYDYYKIGELKEVYYDNFSFLMDLYETWDIEGLNDRYPNGAESGLNGTGSSQSQTGSSGQASSAGMGGSMPGASGGTSGSGSPGGGSSSEADKLTVYDMMDELVTKNGEEYEEAMNNYERDTAMAAASLDQARSSLATLQAQLQEAELEYEKQVITSKVDYDTAIAENENAESVYDTSVKKLEEDLQALKDDAEEAKENLEIFEGAIGDGYFYTQSAGTIVMNRVRTDSYLSSEDILFAYSDPETVTVAASVDQADIAAVAVGDNAYVIISEYGNYEGKVISIDPISSSGSKSAVTFTITVELSGDITNLESNLTSYVYLGLSEAQIEQMRGTDSRNSGSGSENGRTDGGNPENSGDPESGNMDRTNEGSQENTENPGNARGTEDEESPAGMESREGAESTDGGSGE